MNLLSLLSQSPVTAVTRLALLTTPGVNTPCSSPAHGPLPSRSRTMTPTTPIAASSTLAVGARIVRHTCR